MGSKKKKNIFNPFKTEGPEAPAPKKAGRLPMPTHKEVEKLFVPGKNIILYRVMPAMKTTGGLFIPVEALDSSEIEYPHMGVILVAGAELDQEKFNYGFFVSYNQFGGRRYKNMATGHECVVINENDVLAVDPEFCDYNTECVLNVVEIIDDTPPEDAQKESAIIQPSSKIIH